MNASELIKKAQQDFALLSRLPICTVTGFSKTDEGWMVSAEAVERKAIPETMDVLGLYEIRLDSEGNILGFDRRKLRKRGETAE